MYDVWENIWPDSPSGDEGAGRAERGWSARGARVTEPHLAEGGERGAM